MFKRKSTLRVLAWDLTEDAARAVRASFTDAEVLAFGNSAESERVARAVAEFLPDVIVCTRVAFQSLRRRDAKPSQRGLSVLPRPAAMKSPISIGEIYAAARAKQRLSPRDGEIVLMLYRGLTNKEIAQHFGISARTVKGYLSHLFAMFDVSNRTELVGVAVDLGLVETAPGAAAPPSKAAS